MQSYNTFPRLLFRGLLFAAALVLTMGLLHAALPARAAGGVYGNLSGNVIDATTHAAIVNAQVVATSPSGIYKATTNGSGYFSMLGVASDTYTVTVTANGYKSATISNVGVDGDENDGTGTIELTAT